MVFKTNFNFLRQAEITSDKIMKLRPKYSNLSLAKLKKEFEKQKEIYNTSLKNKDVVLDSILEEVYGIVEATIKHIVGFSLHKVQLIGAILLHHGDLAEMRTGEGKTITAVLPAALNSIADKGVHIVTVNEYLADRDAYEMGKVFSELGITVGCVTKDTRISKKLQYAKDVVYITNSELGFDYLRDNMTRAFAAKVQRGFHYAIIDEADSVLIDEARTPLIISGGGKPQDEVYKAANAFIKTLKKDDFEFDVETKSVSLTSSGVELAENFFKMQNLYAVENSEMNHRIHNALQAHNVFTKEVEYTVRDNQIELIDIFTGRILDGRMYSNGLHQAIQAKENTEITPESVTHATITYQNLFRLYKKLSGMSGTAKTEEEEFLKIYNMRVFEVPTNKPIIRIDHVDAIYSIKKYKWENVILDIQEKIKTGQPILIGTRSVEDSEHLHNLLKIKKIKHEVLNAKNHSREAEIIAKAGKKGSITLSTNMAGRGTDIKLGEGVIELGGLYVIGTERHESRRIDNQLRGRAGRQGDIGESRFYISLEDEIMIRSGSEKIKKIFNAKNPDKLESKLVTKSLTSAQKRIEGMNFDMRKNVIEYDNVLNQQRKVIYKQRDNFLVNENLISSILVHYIKTVCEEIVNLPYFKHSGRLNFDLLVESMQDNLFGSGTITKDMIENKSDIEIVEILQDKMIDKFNSLYDKWNDKSINLHIREILIGFLDKNWQDHINQLQKLRATIEYRQYAQKKPIQIYIEEADELFKQTRERVYHGVIKTLLSSSVVKPQSSPTKTINLR